MYVVPLLLDDSKLNCSHFASSSSSASSIAKLSAAPCWYLVYAGVLVVVVGVVVLLLTHLFDNNQKGPGLRFCNRNSI